MAEEETQSTIEKRSPVDLLQICKSQREIIEQQREELKKMQVDMGVLIGINHYDSILLVKSTLESGRMVRDMFALTPVLGRNIELLKQRDKAVAGLDADIAVQQKRLDIAISRAHAFYQENPEIAQVLVGRYHIDIPGLIAKGEYHD